VGTGRTARSTSSTARPRSARRFATTHDAPCRGPWLSDGRGSLPRPLVRVFLDRTVLVSAFTARGLGFDPLHAVVAEHGLVLGETVMAELHRALRRTMGMSEAVVRAEDHQAPQRLWIVRPCAKEPAVGGQRDVMGRNRLHDLDATGGRVSVDLPHLLQKSPTAVQVRRGRFPRHDFRGPEIRRSLGDHEPGEPEPSRCERGCGQTSAHLRRLRRRRRAGAGRPRRWWGYHR